MNENWKQWLEKLKSRILICSVSGLVLGLMIIGLCVLCYSRGIRDGKENAGKQAEEAKSVLKYETKQEASPSVVDISKAASQAAVAVITSESVTVEEGTENAVSAENESPVSSTDGQNQSKGSNNQPGSQGQAAAGGATGSASAGGAHTGNYAGKLAVVGNQLCTADGTPIQLRGISTHGLGWFPEYVNAAMFGELRSWGANTVRLAMYTAEYNGYCSGGDKNKLKNLVKQGVQYATEQDLYVIIDWHILSDGNPNTHKAEAVEFFAEMADLYKDNDHVLYEICNEPNGGVSWSEIKRYANEVIPVIRARDPDGVILVGTPTWSQEVDQASADPITGYNNIMYTLHFYANTHRDSLRNTLAKAVGSGLPVFVSEFGICDASGNGGVNTEQGDLWIQTLNQYGVSYIAWNLSNKAESSALIQSGCSRTNGITEGDLTESGRWLLKTLQGSIGSVPANPGSVQNTQQNPVEPDHSSQQVPSADQNNNQQNNMGSDSSNSSWQPPVQKTPEQFTPQPGGGAEAVVVNSWQEGNAFNIQYEIKVNNTTGGVQDGWNGSLTFPANAQVVSGWNANFSSNGNVVQFSAMDYNKTIQPGGKAEGIGCIVRFE